MSGSEHEVNDEYYPIGQDVEDMKRALRAGKKYLKKGAVWWAEQLESVFAPELIEDVTGIPQVAEPPEQPGTPRQDFFESMMCLAAFKVKGTHYDPAWEVNFPIFDGEAPEGHPYPLAFAANFGRQEEYQDEVMAARPGISPVRRTAARRAVQRSSTMLGATSVQPQRRDKVASKPEFGAFRRLRM
jgi:hypothetical protein